MAASIKSNTKVPGGGGDKRTKATALRLEHFKWSAMIGVPTVYVPHHEMFTCLTLAGSLIGTLILKPNWVFGIAHWLLPAPDQSVKLNSSDEANVGMYNKYNARDGPAGSRGRLPELA